MKTRLELVFVPVSDIDRAQAFYVEQAGFAVDVDVPLGDGGRFVQLTPPGSACSIALGAGIPEVADMPPGSLRALHLVVKDADAARAAFLQGGVAVGEIDDVGGGVRFARFADPDGNTWWLQEMPWRSAGID